MSDYMMKGRRDKRHIETYRKYSNTSDDKYPTFSICFKGSLFHWYRDIDIYNDWELMPEQYEKMMKGEPAFRYVETI